MSDWLAPFVRHVVAPTWALWERSAYLSHVRTLRRTEWLPAVEIALRQRASRERIARHAWETTTFYREHWAHSRLENLADDDNFRALPVVTKDQLRERGAELRSTQPGSRELHVHHTSGSTGKSLSIVVDDRAQQWRRACTLRSDEWTGWRLGQRSALVWGNPEYQNRGWRGRLRNTLLERGNYLDTLRMDAEALERFVATGHRQRPALLMGHAHSLYLLARFVSERNLSAWQPRGIIATAMTLHDFERQTIEMVFGTRVTNRYGCEEVGLIACQCSQFCGLHVNADNVLVEILREDGQPADSGESGSVIVTDLTNRAMPLIRYQLGDVAMAGDEACPCGRGLPLLARIEGRDADYIVTPRGELISGISLTENFAVLLEGVREMQIVQERVEFLRLRIVRDVSFGPATTRHIERLVRERFGEEMSHECEWLERIEPEASGKFRFCVSRLADPIAAQRQAVGV